jgi:APA family basic amino acid/polyamine antiporter
VLFGDAGAPTDATIAAIPHGIWSSFGYTTQAKMAALPNTLLVVTLASNFGTFVLYALSCALCMVAYTGHPNFSLLRHRLIPILGLLANLMCMGAYLVLPFLGIGTKIEPWSALGIAAVWAIYGAVHFLQVGKTHGKSTIMESRTPVA